MVTDLMKSAKIATLGYLKKKVFWNKVYNVMFSVYDISNKVLSCSYKIDPWEMSSMTPCMVYYKLSHI